MRTTVSRGNIACFGGTIPLVLGLVFAALSQGSAANPLTFVVGTTNAVTNSEVVVPIVGSNFANVASFQFSLHWTTNVASFVGIEQLNLPGLGTNDSFGMSKLSNGTLTVAWLSDANTNVLDGTVLFAVRFHFVGPPAASTTLSIDGLPTAIVAGDENGVALTNGVAVLNGVLSIDHTLLYACPTNKTVECGTLWGFDPPVIIDSCTTNANGATVSVLSLVTNVTGTCGSTATCTWELYDACNNRATCSQTVRVVDTTPPQVTCASNKTVEFGLAWDFDAPIATDNCTSADSLVVRIVSTDINTNGRCGLTFVATRVWEISDGCTNKASCSQTVTLRDTIPPTITCPANKTVNCLAPWSFDVPAAVDFPATTVTNVIALNTVTNGTCGNNFSATRIWRATDACGNTSICSQVVFGRALVDVSGAIFCATNYPPSLSDLRVPGVPLLAPSNTVSATDGVFNCIFDATTNVVITPMAPTNGYPADGISTLDVTLVRRHILAIASLDLPYKLLAADVDGSGAISTLDLSMIRRVILGTTNRFPLGLWRFVPANFTFTNPLAPWNAPINRSYASVNADVSSQNFVAIKLGDVNNSWTPPAAGSGFSSRPLSIAPSPVKATSEKSLSPVSFTVGSRSGLPGSDVLIPVTVTGFTNVTGFQFSFHWDTNVATFAGFDPFGIGFSSGMYNTNPASSGTITFAWNDETPEGSTTVANGTAVITMRFKCIGSPSMTSSLFVDDAPTARGVDVGLGTGTYAFVSGQITILQPNRAPVLGNVSDKTVNEKTLLTFTATVTDADGGQTHSFSLDSGAPAGASINANNGLFTWTPTEAQGPGVYSITIRVTDSGSPGSPALSDAKTMVVTVNEVNSAPVANADSYGVNEDSVLTVTAPGVLGNDTDADGDALSAALLTSTSHGTLTFNANGSFTYRPATNFNGSDSFTYRVSDGQVASASATVTINVAAVNDSPVLSPISPQYVVRGSLLTFRATAADVDAAQTLTFSLPDSPFGAAIDPVSGVFTWTPDVSGPSTNYITVRVTDSGSPRLSAEQTAAIVIDESVRIAIEDTTTPGGTAGSFLAALDVHLSAPSSQPISVDFATADWTAVSNVDYMAVAGTLVFPPGETNQSIEVTVIGNSSVHTNRAFLVTLANPTNAILDAPQATATILDDPAAGLVITDASLVEGSRGVALATFSVDLWPPSDRTVTVRYATIRGTARPLRNFRPMTGLLRFPPGTTNRVITVPVIGNLMSESNNTFAVNLRRAVNAVIARTNGFGTILDDDVLPDLLISDARAVEMNSGARAMIFNVRLSARSGRAVAVDYSTADDTAFADSDYIAVNGTLLFPPGVLLRRLLVPIIGDRVGELRETFTVNLSNPVNAGISRSQGVGTIQDNDPAASSLNAAALRTTGSDPMRRSP